MPERFTVSILGLGLMGGSLAYALRGFRDCVIAGYDIRPEVTARAQERGAINVAAGSAAEAAGQADLCLLCADPEGILQSVAACRESFRPGCVVSEICGVKADMARKIPALLPAGVPYVGLHPMAGKEIGGFDNADASLFRGAGFILIPPEDGCENALALVRELSIYVGAGRVIVNTPEEHDDIIAYSSDLPHVTATALVAAYPENLTMTHTAGAFRDCTRIADIDADLWTELLLLNREPLLPRLDEYMENLAVVRDALRQGDAAALRGFLTAAGNNKRRIQTL